MSFLSQIQQPTANVAEEKDTLGGGFSLLDSDIYLSTIKSAYLSKATSGAMALNLEVTTEQGQNHSETLYFTNKAGSVTYKNKNGEENYLPSYITADAIALFTTQKPLVEQTEEAKVINVYNFDQKKEVPTQVPMLVDMLGKQVNLAILKQVVDKVQKDSSGKYVPTGETKEENVISKVFHPTNLKTTVEIKAQKDAEFHEAWLSKYKGQVVDKTSKKPATTAKQTTSSLFA